MTLSPYIDLRRCIIRKRSDSRDHRRAAPQKLAARIKELRNGTPGVGNLRGGAVGFGNSEVRDAVLTIIKEMLPTATNVPTGPVQAAARIKVGANRRDADGIATEVEKVYAKQVGTAGAICVTLVGESHQHLDGSLTADHDRAKTLLTFMTTGGRLDATGVVLLERKMEARYKPYPMPFAPNSMLETEVPRTGGGTLEAGLDLEQRDYVLAGYLFLTLAGGDQSTIDNIVVFRGSRHVEFLDKFEYFAKTAANVTGVDRVARRPRTLVFADSLLA
ncbi:hypothetical protein [Virgisporangium aurantiacum]|uniref:Uncharacterized protein n=1 Tax=Virgisporangium aurantiacum TaxID=175570 RepID=A0A8J3Z7M4_9ACTN|nr:hypothetical protein [Virgisporangium aurantiacum]GIJ56721.1 hypothetical protein Vau01_042370 [Virgisporangium aurantiacum]